MKKTLLRWYLKKLDDGTYFAENGESNAYIRHAHCRACAYAEIIGTRGGDADLRGMKNNPCYQFLAVMVRNERSPQEDAEQ